MDTERFEPIRLTYEGLDADDALVDLGQLGLSLQGSAKLIAGGGHIALTGRFNRTEYLNSVRVLTRPATVGSYDLLVMLAPLVPLATPYLPVLQEVIKSAATKAVEAVVNATIAKWAGKAQQADASRQIAITALQEMGQTSRAAIDAMERMSATMHGATKNLVAPIGSSAATLMIGKAESGAFKIDREDREAIEKKSDVDVGEERTWTVQFSELDLVTRHCKVSLANDDRPGHRVAGMITDPAVQTPGNPYSSAFDAQRSIEVRAKAQYVAGEIDRLFISNTA